MSQLITLSYWENIRGRIQPIRLLLNYLNIAYTEKNYQIENWEEWYEKDKPSLQIPFANLPLILHNQKAVCETETIYLYLCSLSSREDLTGLNMNDRLNIATTKGVVFDLMQSYVEVAFSELYSEEFRDSQFTEKVKPKLEKLNHYLEKNEFLNEGKLCIVDFFLFEAVQVLKAMDPKLLEAYANLLRQVSSFSKLDSISKYLNSDIYPKNDFFFGPSAFWKK